MQQDRRGHPNEKKTPQMTKGLEANAQKGIQNGEMPKLQALHRELNQSTTARGATNLQLGIQWTIRAVTDRKKRSKGVL